MMPRGRRFRLFVPALAAVIAAAPATTASACGEVVTIETHDRTTTRYALARGAEARIGLVLLVGGGGHLDLDAAGCPRALAGNPLVRMAARFHQAGFVTALVDAPPDHPGEDGLAGFRVAPAHAQDLGRVVADLRARVGGPVWIVGHSRGTLSAANAAARLAGAAAPDGLVLLSAMMVGDAGARKPWVAQTVFDLPLAAIAAPALFIGHAADACLRSPARQMTAVAARLGGARREVVTVGAADAPAMAAPSLAECRARAPHGFIDREAEVVAAIARFIRGESP